MMFMCADITDPGFLKKFEQVFDGCQCWFHDKDVIKRTAIGGTSPITRVVCCDPPRNKVKVQVTPPDPRRKPDQFDETRATGSMLAYDQTKISILSWLKALERVIVSCKDRNLRSKQYAETPTYMNAVDEDGNLKRVHFSVPLRPRSKWNKGAAANAPWVNVGSDVEGVGKGGAGEDKKESRVVRDQYYPLGLVCLFF